MESITIIKLFALFQVILINSSQGIELEQTSICVPMDITFQNTFSGGILTDRTLLTFDGTTTSDNVVIKAIHTTGSIPIDVEVTQGGTTDTLTCNFCTWTGCFGTESFKVEFRNNKVTMKYGTLYDTECGSITLSTSIESSDLYSETFSVIQDPSANIANYQRTCYESSLSYTGSGSAQGRQIGGITMGDPWDADVQLVVDAEWEIWSGDLAEWGEEGDWDDWNNGMKISGEGSESGLDVKLHVKQDGETTIVQHTVCTEDCDGTYDIQGSIDGLSAVICSGLNECSTGELPTPLAESGLNDAQLLVTIYEDVSDFESICQAPSQAPTTDPTKDPTSGF